MNVRASLLACALVSASVASCSLPNSFTCTSDAQCGAGQCIAGGCAFISGDCLSGLKFGELAPEPLAGNCVGVDTNTGVADHDGSGEGTSFETGGMASTSTTATESSSTTDPSTTDPSTTDPSTTDPSTTDPTATDTTDTGTTGDEIPDTAIAHYSFDDISPPTIFDSTANAFDAEMDNLQSTGVGVVGDGLVFGSLDRVIVPIDVLAGRTAFTVEFYLLVTQMTAPRQFLFYYGHELNTALEPYLTYYVEYTAPPLKTSRVVWTSGSATGLIGTTNVAENGWHHIAMTFSDAGMRLYVNHFLDDEDPLVPALQSPNLAWIQIGGVPTGFGSFTGVIDELRFSEGALTPAQMQPIP
jgi:hypothetical protein